MVRQCTNCGAAVDVPETVLSTSCRFCDSPLVDVAGASAVVDAVVPFVVPRSRAKELLGTWLQARWLAPEAVRRPEQVDRLEDVFVPVYAFDAVARTRWSADVGIHWQRTETYTTTENGKTVTKTRTVTETEWFPTSGTHAKQWVDHLVSASQGLTEEESNALEPFDLGAGVPFEAARVAGVVAEHATVPPDAARHTAEAEVAARQEEVIREAFLPGDTHRRLDTATDLEVAGVSLALVPVWVTVVRGGDHAVRLLVNGQTGEVVADVPTDWGKVAVLVVAGLALLMALAAAVYVLGGLG